VARGESPVGSDERRGDRLSEEAPDRDGSSSPVARQRELSRSKSRSSD
jgi:hypothetical protein